MSVVSDVTGTQIHPTAVIGPGVELGIDVSIGPYAVIVGPTTIGDGVWVGSSSQIGAPPEITTERQNLAWTGDLAHMGVVVERGAVIRESVVIHQGTRRQTIVGQDSWILNRAYLAHDVQLGTAVTLSAGVSVGGKVTIRDRVNVGLNASIHQGCRLGALSMIGMGATVNRDVHPYAKAFGVPMRIHGLNTIGLRRAGVDDDIVAMIRSAYEDGNIDPALPDLAPAAIKDEFGWWAALSERNPARIEAS